jgi:integrase/recombinase XerC
MRKELTVQTPESQLITEWQDSVKLSVKAGDISNATKTTYIVGMNKFMSWLQQQSDKQVSAKTIQEWKKYLLDLGKKPTSINSWLAGVKRFFEWTVNAGYFEYSPTATIRNVKRPRAGKTHLRDLFSDSEILRLLAQPKRNTKEGKRDYLIMCLAAFCACREVEIYRANIDDLSLDGKYPVIRVQLKNDSEKNSPKVFTHPIAIDALYDYLSVRGDIPGALIISFGNRSRGQRLSLSRIIHSFDEYKKDAGIISSRKTFHSFRHSAVSKVALLNIMKAQQLAGHASLEPLLIYVHQNDRLENPPELLIDYKNGNGK